MSFRPCFFGCLRGQLVTAIFSCVVVLTLSDTGSSAEIHVATTGSDRNPGTAERPFATLEQARTAARAIARQEPIHIIVAPGVYRLQETLVLGPEDSGTTASPIIWEAAVTGETILSGSRLLKLTWKPWKDGIFQAQVPDGVPEFDQLYVNGVRQIRARFPNILGSLPDRGTEGYLLAANGTDRRPDSWVAYDDSFSQKQWAHPETGILHAFQSHNWGNLQYRIRLNDTERRRLELGVGGWQLQRRFGVKKGTPFFVENLLEELDSPGEWFYDSDQKTVYFWPKISASELPDAVIEAVTMKDLIHLKGTVEHPIQHLTFKGFRFTHARMTFREQYEPVSRSDWSIHRGGALFLEGADGVQIADCEFRELGGNAIFFSGYNRRSKVTRSKFEHTGESAIAVVGHPSSVRNYLTWDDQELLGKNLETMSQGMSLESGPQGPDYPAEIEVEHCQMSDLGDYGKQIAGVFVAMAHRISVRHCTILRVPRAAICIGDGTWGGHLIEHCDIWDAVRETGEHGPFNAWGRDRFWQTQPNRPLAKELAKLDAIDPVVIRHNRIANYRPTISAGNWTIDLDDGASHYEIVDNLSLGSTLKLRDGFYRTVRNNIHVSPVPLGWHVWPEESEDVFEQNITVVTGSPPNQSALVQGIYRPIKMPAGFWGKRTDRNLYWNVNTRDFQGQANFPISWEQWRDRGYDQNGKFASPKFIDPSRGDYRVSDDCPSKSLGFKNFAMSGFGHQLTRFEPQALEFVEQLDLTIHPDHRGGVVHYTTDGTEPTLQSPVAAGPIRIQESTRLRARTFADGKPVGLIHSRHYQRNDSLVPQSWLASLLAEKYVAPRIATASNSPASAAKRHSWRGSEVVNIQSDPDLIDAAGGWNQGVFIHQIASDSELRSWGLEPSDIIFAVNGVTVNGVKQLQKRTKSPAAGTVFSVRRGYKTIQITSP